MKLTTFMLDGNILPVLYSESVTVTEGVTCDVYSFENDNTKDLGIVTIQPGKKTPPQTVLKGDITIEGYISGNGTLHIIRDSNEQIYPVGNNEQFSMLVLIGDTMQWHAEIDSILVIYEVCYPPYEEGRFRNE